MRMIDRIDETFDYIRAPEYFLVITGFCIGFGLTNLGMMTFTMENFLGPSLLVVGGMGLTVMSFVFGYNLYMDR